MRTNVLHRGRGRAARLAGGPDPDELRNRELVDVVAELGAPLSTAQLGLHCQVGYWKHGRSWIEVVFDQYGRAERVRIT
jgi:hypothetical protein